jgi:putative restriction endonuclease
MQDGVGDWAVFFTPVKDPGVSAENRGAYFAHARVGQISEDPSDPSKYYATIDPGTFESFASTVPRIVDGRFVEPELDGSDGKANSGVAQQAVRRISDGTYEFILSRAWIGMPSELPRVGEDSPMREVADELTPFVFDYERQVVPTMLNRKLRDRRFRHAVLGAYEKRCAVTGWQFVNGGGRAEVEAAHIKPVEHGGNDSINNGIAMSGTVH